MAASLVLLFSFVLVFSAQMAYTNIILECLSILLCDGKTPVCGSNGTHCWQSHSDCERVKFNCLQLYKKDFDKVDLRYCDNLTMGYIIPCCVEKICHNNKKEPICGQTSSRAMHKCKWFRNRCEMENYNCASGKHFAQIHSSYCKFEYGANEQHCTHTSTTTTASSYN